MEQIYSMLGISAEVEAFGNAVLKDLKFYKSPSLILG